MDRTRTGSISSGRSRSSASMVQGQAQLDIGNSYEPCAATAAIFLYASGKSIICHHHDTLAVDKKFERHSEDILLIAADNVSNSPGRLVVSYDVGLTAIIWDLFTSDEVSRFASYNTIRVCSWVRNGSIAFGNSKGEIILFDPTTSEHLSVRTIYDPITAIAPNSDCQTYALGYMNGSILIASLLPNFTIKHTLSTSRAPAPIVSLAWHGSARGHKTEMLATQTRDGDLRVWSVAKDSRPDPPKIVRILKRSDNYMSGPNWLAWSKNGRIIQQSEGSTALWDVRTKNITYEIVPTTPGLSGIAAYGANASLFTLSHDFSVQQFELNPPALVATHKPVHVVRPSPPASTEGRRLLQNQPNRTKPSIADRSSKLSSSLRSDEGHNLSSIDRYGKEMAKIEKRREQRNVALSTASSVPPSHTASTTSLSSIGSRFYGNGGSTSRAETNEGVTIFSQTSSIHTGRPNRTPPSVASSQRSAQSRGSRLRNEVLRSPDTPLSKPLFSRTSARLSDVPYRNPSQDRSTLTPADLRKQMLSVVFGWHGDIDTLIRDEQINHAKGSLNSVILSKWLGDQELDIMENLGSDAGNTSEWMIIALTSFNGTEATKKTAQALVRRLLSKNDIHTAVIILLGLGDFDDAVEAYVSHKYYMEAVLLSSLVFPEHWQRIAELLKKWGEFEVTQGQNPLAIRCFACTGQEPTEEWTSPRAQKATFDQEMQSITVHRSTSPGGSGSGPIVSPASSGTGRMPRKGGALKLITTFDNAKKPAVLQRDESRTPVIIAHTPIDTAITPGGFRSFDDIRTSTPAGGARNRLTSIGETVGEATPETTIRSEPPIFPKPRPERSSRGSSDLPLRSSQDASVSLEERFYTDMRNGPLTSDSKSSNPEKRSEKLANKSSSRGVSRDRKPNALNLEIGGSDLERPGSRPRHHRSNTESYVATPPITGRSLNSVSTLRSPVKSTRTIDDFLNSLENPSFASQTLSFGDVDKRGRNEQKSRTRNASESRGRRDNRYASSGKRSPSSPVPMSPDDAHLAANESLDERFNHQADSKRLKPINSRSRTASKSRPNTRPTSRQQSRKVSPEPRPASRSASRIGARAPSRRRQSPTPSETRSLRDRGNVIQDGPQKSPSSPIPMSPHLRSESCVDDDEDEDEKERQYMEEVRKRYRARQRSASRKNRDHSLDASRARSSSRKPKERGTASRQELYGEQHTDSRHRRDRAESLTSSKSYASTRSASHRHTGNDTVSTKELAARELEDRRKSLAQKSAASPFPHPGDIGRSHDNSEPKIQSSRDLALLRSRTVSPLSTSRAPASSGGISSLSIGLPATPRAMRHPKDTQQETGIPAVPEIPNSLSANLNAKSAEFESNFIESIDALAPLPQSTYVPPKQIPRRAASAPIEEHAPSHVPHLHPLSFDQILRKQQGKVEDTYGNQNLKTYQRSVQLNPKEHVNNPSTGDGDDTPLDETLNDVELLPELQHLTQTTYHPPPPPPPFHYLPDEPGRSNAYGAGVINIAIDGDRPSIEVIPQSLKSPSLHAPGSGNTSRQGRDAQELFGHKLMDRMKNTSRSRNKSPTSTRDFSHSTTPYESVSTPSVYYTDGPQIPRESAKQLSKGSPQGLERHPRELRAEVTSEMAKLGFTEGGMI
ncbi:MAG: hypothetical protein M1814_000783 [Vezdaea aestivalis]|nr:MAG: hypothetical protein M1814_000783 [Vezdaea aestivalis]